MEPETSLAPFIACNELRIILMFFSYICWKSILKFNRIEHRDWDVDGTAGIRTTDRLIGSTVITGVGKDGRLPIGFKLENSFDDFRLRVIWRPKGSSDKSYALVFSCVFCFDI